MRREYALLRVHPAREAEVSAGIERRVIRRAGQSDRQRARGDAELTEPRGGADADNAAAPLESQAQRRERVRAVAAGRNQIERGDVATEGAGCSVRERAACRYAAAAIENS